MTFNIEEKDGKVFVFVEIPYKREIKGSKDRIFVRVQTEDIISKLSEKKIKHGKTIEESDIHNWREHTRRGTWVFEKKTTKPLDKPAEEVILSIEESPALKNKSKAKKKTSK
tara:strand:- start:316 stop:651 length:336 start_codon:yes stop_codon:yes gene_type:complete